MIEADKIELIDLDEEDYDTVLASDIFFNGIITFKQPFMIKGTVEGTIQSSSDLMISEHAHVKAKIEADRVIIKGEVIGNVTAATSVHVFSSGTLKGDVTAPEVILDSGCFFSGVCTMNR
ncbi:MAG: polymer-forming cytoskeletal protein [Treponema sp.]